MEISFVQILVTIVVGAISVALTFYIKEYLQKRREYKVFKDKINSIAGKNSTVLYCPEGGKSADLFKIIDIGSRGITFQNELQTIYVPVSKIIKSEMILPCDNYNKARIEKLKREIEENFDILFPALFEKIFPPMIDGFKKYFIEEMMEEDETEISGAILFKFQKFLKDEGYDIKKIDK